MHEKIVTSLFSDSGKATATIGRLEAAGIPSDHIATFGAGSDRRWDARHGSPASRDATSRGAVPSVGTTGASGMGGASGTTGASGMSGASAGMGASAATGTSALGAGSSSVDPSADIATWLESVGVPHHDADAYAEGTRRGGALVVVSCVDDKVDTVVDIVDQEGVVDLEERRSAWASEGWTGRKSNGNGNGSDKGDTVIPIAEEELHVGKRETAGRVRIHKHVVARPTEESVELRDEHVSVDRRPVDRVVGSSERDGLFEEQTVEMTERHEKPVVTKEAHVREELVVHKDVDRHRETVRDTTRRTEVDVENDRGRSDGSGPARH